MALTVLPGGLTFTNYEYIASEAAKNLDAVTSGMAISLANTTTVRIGAGTAVVGGMSVSNPSNLDVATTVNSSGSTRVYRLLLRRTTDTTTDPTHPATTVTAVIVNGTGPIGPALTKTAAPPGVYEVPLARWAQANGSQLITNLVSDGPGPGAMQVNWASYAVVTSGAESGFPGDGTGGMELHLAAGGAYGPQPASIATDNLYVAITGLYSVNYSVAMLAATGSTYLHLALPGENCYEEFGTRKRAVISRAGIFIPAGTNIRPLIFHDTGVAVSVDFAISLSRSTSGT